MLTKYLERFNSKNIVVIGDLMLDKYILGSVDRISPEAPVPVIEVKEEKFVPGGAANAANNIVSLSGNAYLAGLVGNDVAKDILLGSTKDKGINTQAVAIDMKRPTIQKIRVIGGHQQLLRIDYENKVYSEKNLSENIMSKLKAINKIDAIIVSDYAKGMITKEIINALKEYGKEKQAMILVDPKPKHMDIYNGVDLITPNKKEAEEMVHFELNSKEAINKAGNILGEKLGCDVLFTLGDKGMALCERGKMSLELGTAAKEVFDVSGAGDTVIATLALSLASNASLKEAATLANLAAGIKVSKLGTAPVTLHELKAAIKE